MAVADRTETYGELEYARAQLRLYMYLGLRVRRVHQPRRAWNIPKVFCSHMAVLAEGHWQTEPNHWCLPL